MGVRAISRVDPFLERLYTVPEAPGVYIFKDKRGRVLYVGKAKNLRARLRSYFQPSAELTPRIEAMLRKVDDFSFIVTDTEREALALEASLIKQQKPRYNIVLRDDKNYPYLKLSRQEQWPTLEVVRRIGRDGAEYFGPYIPASSVWETLAFVRKHFGIRPCRYRLDRPRRPCIQYQMGRCPAPCAGLISRQEYMKAVDEVVRFLRGRKDELLSELERKMWRLSDEMRFEEAAKVRDRLKALKRAFESQKVVSSEPKDIDIIGMSRQGEETLVVVFFVRSGIMIGMKDFLLRETSHLDDRMLLAEFIKYFYAKEMVMPERIVVPIEPSDRRVLEAWLADRRSTGVQINTPQEEKEEELLQMAQTNASMILSTRLGAPTEAVLRSLRDRLHLTRIPHSIGGFDISTIYGSFSVGAFVWWEDGEFKKDRYRHLKIREVKGIDDYAMMREVLRRILLKLEDLPDLILVDGGRGHLEVALEVASEVLGDAVGEVEIVSIAKSPDRVFLPDGRVEPADDPGAEAILLRRIRDEAHRFAISFHRRLRGKEALASPLERIKGIGKKRRLALLRRFGSVEAIRKATVEEIAETEGMNRPLAERVLRELNSGSV